MPELKFQATPRQWALIFVLSVALITVLVVNQPAGSGEQIALAVLPPAKASAASPPLDVAGRRPRLPEFTAELAASVNPFGRRAIADARAKPHEAIAGETQAAHDLQARRKAEQAKALADLRSKKVRFVIENEHGGAALLGDQPVRIGQIVSGFRVVKIDPTGVELEPAE